MGIAKRLNQEVVEGRRTHESAEKLLKQIYGQRKEVPVGKKMGLFDIGVKRIENQP